MLEWDVCYHLGADSPWQHMSMVDEGLYKLLCSCNRLGKFLKVTRYTVPCSVVYISIDLVDYFAGFGNYYLHSGYKYTAVYIILPTVNQRSLAAVARWSLQVRL